MFNGYLKPKSIALSRPGQTSLATVILFGGIIIFALVTAFNIHKFSPIIVLAVVSGLVVGLITLVNTNFGLVILIFSMLWSPEIPLAETVERAVVVRVDDFLIMAVFFAWLAKMAFTRQTGFVRHTVLNKPIFAFLCTTVFSTFLGVLRADVNLKSSLFHILKFTEFFMIYFLFTNNIKNLRQLKFFIFFFLICSFFVGIFAYSQFGTEVRPSAPFEGGHLEPNTLGGYLMFTMAIAAGLFLYTIFSPGKFLLGGLFCFNVPPLLATGSRSSYGAIAVAMAVLTLITKKSKMFMLFLLTLSILFVPLVIPEAVKKRISSTFESGQTYEIAGQEVSLEPSAAARFVSMRDILERLPKRPIFGYGVLGAGFIETQYVRYILELGLFGFLIVVWLIISVIINSWRIYKASEDDFSGGLALGFLVGYIGLLVMGLGASVFVIVRIAEPLWFMVACVMAIPEIYQAEEAGD